MGKFQKGKPSVGKTFKKGMTPWNKGKRDTNRFVVEGDLVRMDLTRGKQTIFNKQHLGKALQYKWSALKGYNTYYAATRNGDKSLSLHQLLTGNSLTDHKDRDGLNNRDDNLRCATRSINSQNRDLNRNSKTGYRGVFFRKESGKFRAWIRKDGKLYHIGTYSTSEDAAHAYDAKALELFGPSAKLNFPQGPVI